MARAKRDFNGPYRGDYVNHVAFPLGGIGAGMICLEGSGSFSHLSVCNQPDVFNEPLMFAAVSVKGVDGGARLLRGPVPTWKVFGPSGAGNGGGGRDWGLPRFAEAEFAARFPFATVDLEQPGLPVKASITGWSPFIPGNADDSSLPMAALEYRLENTSDRPLDAVFSFHARNVFCGHRARDGRIDAAPGGFICRREGSTEEPWKEGAFSVVALENDVAVDCCWFRGGWFDALTMVWKAIAAGKVIRNAAVGGETPSPGGSLYVPLALRPGAARTVRLLLNWYVPRTSLRSGADPEDGSCCTGGACSEKPAHPATHVPWYAGRFESIGAVIDYTRGRYNELRAASARFRDCFYDQTLPPEVIEAIAANLTILKSPTVLRQADGRLWAWEGCCDGTGCCAGSCTHVWNYAQALPHLFPSLERSLRQTEFNESQDARGHQTFRAALPIRAVAHKGHAAADGQLGGIMKVYREWRISGDTGWLRGIWPRVRQSLDYCIDTWDPDRRGVLVEPHHNTYDIEFWGPDGMCGSFYLGALRAAAFMAAALGDDAAPYDALYKKGRRYLEKELFNGEYFFQDIRWQGLRAGDPTEAQALINVQYTPEARELLEREGPKYQYGTGCLADGVLGAWIAAVCGVGDVLNAGKVRKHLRSVFRYNFRKDLSDHANPQRPTYALGRESGLLLCTWPRGGALSLPFPYSNEVWTGFEYQAASHLMMAGAVREGLAIVRAARERYDGRVRNPFNEYECGHWYARAMSSYGLIQGLTGIRYDAVDRTLTIAPRIAGDFRAFLATATGYGAAGVRDGRPFVDVVEGRIEVKEIVYAAK